MRGKSKERMRMCRPWLLTPLFVGDGKNMDGMTMRGMEVVGWYMTRE